MAASIFTILPSLNFCIVLTEDLRCNQAGDYYRAWISLDSEFELGRQDVRSGSRVLTLARIFVSSLVGLERCVQQPTGKVKDAHTPFLNQELPRTCLEPAIKNRPGTTLSLPMPQKALEWRLIKADVREESLGINFCALFIYPDERLWKNRLHFP